MAKLGEILVRRGVVTAEDIATALQRRLPGERIGEALVRLGITSAREVARALAEQTGLQLADLRGRDPEPRVLESVPTRFVFRTRVVPIARNNGRLQVATADPFCVSELDELRLLTGLDVEPCLAAKDELDEAIHRLYGVGADALDQAEKDGVVLLRGSEAQDEGNLDVEDDAALIQFVNRLLLDAITARASDIHIEPGERDLKIRYRVDGVLHPAALPRELKRFQAAITSRLKIMASLDIAEKRLPQDGRIRLRVGGAGSAGAARNTPPQDLAQRGPASPRERAQRATEGVARELDVRVSVIPTLHGEGVALRILDSGGPGLGLPEVGLSAAHANAFRRFLAAPHGIVLVTGPTGSGKSTTLYAGLREVDRAQNKVITIEDPVEYRLDGVSQIQVQDKIGLTFGRGLRHVLRHDPDIVMVGEIRDQETGEIAVQAALTGHLVLSTLHTNDAAGAVARLVDMGVEPYLVAATIEGLLAQRLLRRVCETCAEEVAPDPGDPVVAELGLADLRRLRRGTGCEACLQQGYYGQTGVFEVIPVDDGLRELATQAASAVRLRTYARERGYASLRDDGCRLVREGRTTPDEVVRVTRAD